MFPIHNTNFTASQHAGVHRSFVSLGVVAVRTTRKWDSQLHDEIKMGCALKDVLQRNDVGVLNSVEDKWMESSSQTGSLLKS